MDIKQLREAGFSDSEIKNHLGSAGFSEQEINAYMAPASGFRGAGASGSWEEETPLQSAASGLRSSTAGQLITGKEPEASPSKFWNRQAYAAGMFAGDLPAMFGGGIVGATGGPMGATAGAFAAPAGLHAGLASARAKRENPEVSYSDIIKETAKGTVEGYITGAVTHGAGKAVGMGAEALGAGRLATGTAKTAAEIAGMTATPAAMEGRTPTGQEWLDSVIMIGAIKTAGRAANATRSLFARKQTLNTGDVKIVSEQIRSAHEEAAKQIRKAVDDGVVTLEEVKDRRKFYGSKHPMSPVLDQIILDNASKTTKSITAGMDAVKKTYEGPIPIIGEQPVVRPRLFDRTLEAKNKPGFMRTAEDIALVREAEQKTNTPDIIASTIVEGTKRASMPAAPRNRMFQTRKGAPVVTEPPSTGEMQGDVQVEYKPLFSKSGKPYKTEAMARKAATKAGADVVPVDGGFAVQEKARTIRPSMFQREEAPVVAEERPVVPEVAPETGTRDTSGTLSGQVPEKPPVSSVSEPERVTVPPVAEKTAGEGVTQEIPVADDLKDFLHSNPEKRVLDGYAKANEDAIKRGDYEEAKRLHELYKNPPIPTTVYRGISRAELEGIKKSGTIKSNGSGNFDYENDKAHTLYTGRPYEALSYADGFTMKGHEPTPDKPGYVIEVLSTPGMKRDISKQIVTNESVPVENITRIIEVRPEGEGSPRKYTEFKTLDEALSQTDNKDYPDLAKQAEPAIIEPVTSKKGPGEKPTEATPKPEGGKIHRLLKKRTFYHGTNTEGELSHSFAGANHDHPTSVFGVFFTPDKEIAATYGKRVIEAKLNLSKPYEMSYEEAQSFKTKDEARAFRDKLIKNGYDGVYIETAEYGIGQPQVAVFDASKIESNPNQSRPSEKGGKQSKMAVEPSLKSEPITKESLPSENKSKPGWVWINNQQRPFTEYREIARGKDRGKIQVTVGGKKYAVEKDKVREWPTEPLDKQAENASIAVEEQKRVARDDLKKDNPDRAEAQIERELEETVRAGEEAGISEANAEVAKPVRKRLFDKKAVGAETEVRRETEPRLFDKSKSTYSLSDHDSFMKSLRRGEVSPDEIKQNFKLLSDHEDTIKADLSKLSKDQMLKKMGGMMAYRYKNDRKDVIVKAVLDDMQMDFNLGDSLQYDPFKGGQKAAIQAKVDNYTDADIADFKKRYDGAVEDYKNRLLAHKKALTNPETLEEFETLIRTKGRDSLSPEQQITYDELKSGQIKDKKAQDLERRAVVAKADLENADMEMVKSVHTKKGHDIWVVKLTDRISRDAYKDLNTKAKRLGGYYSSFRGNGAIPGFTFTTEQAARDFMALKEGSVSVLDRVESRIEEGQKKAADRLIEMAGNLEAKANDVLHADRKTNTSKRAREAAHAENAAQANIAFAKTLRQIATAIMDGKAKHLEGLKSATQLETLERLLKDARNNGTQAELKKNPEMSYSDREALRHRTPTIEDVAFAEMPRLSMMKDQIVSLANDLERYGVQGTTRASQKLRKAAAASKNDRVPFVLADDFVREVIGKAESFNKGKPLSRQVTIPWWIKEALAERGRLSRMGIETPEQLRSALRELVTMRKEKQAADPLKAMERDLVGKKIEGFFPTPKPVIERMLSEADIEPGMDVLEPSAGKGDIADSIREQHPDTNLSTVEISSTLRNILQAKGYNPVDSNFLEHKGSYDRIVMNPPFENSKDIDHVRHAYDLLKPGGRIVAIMSEGPFFRSDKKAVDFREWLDENGTSEKLPANSFKTGIFRDTGVNTRIVVIDKPKGQSSVTLASGFGALQPAYEKAVAKVADSLTKWKETSKIPFVSHVRNEQSIKTETKKLVDIMEDLGIKGDRKQAVIRQALGGHEMTDENIKISDLQPGQQEIVRNFVVNASVDVYGKALLNDVADYRGVVLSDKFIEEAPYFDDISKWSVESITSWRVPDMVDHSGETYKHTIMPYEDANHALRTEKDQASRDLRDLMPGVSKGSKVSAMLQDYAEGKITLEDIPARWRDNIQKATDYTKAKYEEWLDRVNEAREMVGKSAIKKRGDYFTHGQEISELANFFGGAERIPNEIAKATQFSHPNSPFFKYEKRLGGQYVADGIGNFLRYSDNALKVIHFTPVLVEAKAYINHLPPYAHEVMQTWADEVLAGKVSHLDRIWDKTFGQGSRQVWSGLRRRMVKNIVLGSARIFIQQPSSFAQTFAELATGKARNLHDVALNVSDAFVGFENVFTGSGRHILKQSHEYRDRMYIDDIDPTMLNKAEKALSFMNAHLDRFMVANAFLGKYRQLIRQGIIPEEAAIEADKFAKRTQASYQKGNLNSILRSDTGKNVLPLQTFTFNIMNHLAFDTKKMIQERGKAATFAYGLTLIAGMEAVNLGYNALGMRETWDWMSAIPGLGYLKYGVTGPLGIIKNLAQIMMGSKEDSAKAMYELKKVPWQILPPFGGEQIRKSIDGYLTITGQKEKKYTIDDDWDRLMAVVFGPGSTGAAREYYEERDPSLPKRLFNKATGKEKPSGSRTRRARRSTRRRRGE